MKKILNKIPKPILQYGWMIILILVLFAFAFRPLRVLNLQARVGDLIDAYIEEYASQYSNFFTCQLPALTDLPVDEELNKAVELLETARSLRPNDSQTNLLLGRAYCLQGEYFNAFHAFEVFSHERPDNPFGKLETAFAHFTLALTEDDISDAEISAHKTRSRQILEEQGVTGGYCLNEGENAYERGDFPVAWYWYRLTEAFSPLSQRYSFKTSLLNAFVIHEISFKEPFVESHFITFENPLRIQPSAFFRLKDGKSINLQEINGQTAAIFATNSDAGGVFIDITSSAQYCLFVQASDRPPEPTKIEMTHNLKRLMMLELPNGDNKWRSFETELVLEAGYHLIGFRLTNDFYQETEDSVIDRNGYVGEVVIKHCD